MHDPDKQDEAAEARRLGGQRRRRERVVQGAYDLDGIRSLDGISRLLDIAVADTLGLENGVQRNRTLVSIVSQAADLRKTGELEYRLAALEEVLLGRKCLSPRGLQLRGIDFIAVFKEEDQTLASVSLSGCIEHAVDEHGSTMASFNDLVSLRKAEAAALAERITALDLGHDGRGSDINGSLLRAAESLRTAKALRRVLLIQSDLIPYGPQHPGTPDLSGVEIVIFFFDCPQGIDCGVFRQAKEKEFLTAGATSVMWLDPASSRLATNIFEAVR